MFIHQVINLHEKDIIFKHTQAQLSKIFGHDFAHIAICALVMQWT